MNEKNNLDWMSASPEDVSLVDETIGKMGEKGEVVEAEKEKWNELENSLKKDVESLRENYDKALFCGLVIISIKEKIEDFTVNKDYIKDFLGSANIKFTKENKEKLSDLASKLYGNLLEELEGGQETQLEKSEKEKWVLVEDNFKKRVKQWIDSSSGGSINVSSIFDGAKKIFLENFDIEPTKENEEKLSALAVEAYGELFKEKGNSETDPQVENEENGKKMDKENLEEQRQKIIEELEGLGDKGYIDKNRREELERELEKIEIMTKGTELEKPEEKLTLEFMSQDEIEKMSAEGLKKEIERVLKTPEFGRAKKYHEAEERGEVLEETSLNEYNKKWREQNEGKFEDYNNYLEALEKERTKKEKEKEPRTTREVIEKLGLLKELEMFEEHLKSREIELAEIEKLKNGEEVTEENKIERIRALGEVERAKINVTTAKGVGASLEVPEGGTAEEIRKDEMRILDKEIMLTDLLSRQLDNYIKINSIENEKVERLSKEKQGAFKKYWGATIDKVYGKLPNWITHENKGANNNQQTEEPKEKWYNRGLLKKVFGDKAEESENDQEKFNEDKLKNAVLAKCLKMWGVTNKKELDDFLDEMKKKDKEKGKQMDVNIEEEKDAKEIAESLFDEYGEEKKMEDLVEIIKEFGFTQKDIKEAVEKMKIDEINYDDYEIVVEPSGKLALWNKKDGDPPVEKGKLFKKGFVDNPNEIIKKLLEQEGGMDMIDVIFNEDEISKVKNAKDIESFNEIAKNHLFKFDFHKDNDKATKYYHSLLFSLHNMLSSYCRKEIDLDELYKSSIKYLATDKKYSENADNYFAVALEKIKEFVEAEKNNNDENSSEGEDGKEITDEMKEIKRELFENAGSKSKEELWELISDVEEILFEEKEEGKGKLKDNIQEIKNSEYGKEKFTDRAITYLPKGGEAIFIGDTHGDPDATVSIIEQEKFIEAMEGGEKNMYLVFLGDYADRGKGDIENLEQVIALKRKYPDNVILLRGNHEELDTGSRYGLNSSISKRYKEAEKDRGRLFKKYNKLFEKMPGVLVCANGVVAVHGGIPSEDIRSLKDLNNEDRLYQMRWNDPIDSENYKEHSINEDRGGDKGNKISLFGRDAFDRFMKTIGGKVMMRGHEYEGIGKPIFDDKLVTLFSNGKGGEKSHYNAHYIVPKYAKIGLENGIDKIDVNDIKQVNYLKMSNLETEAGEISKQLEEKIKKKLRDAKKANKEQFEAVNGLISQVDGEKTVEENCKKVSFLGELLITDLVSLMSDTEKNEIYGMKAKDLVELYKKIKRE